MMDPKELMRLKHVANSLGLKVGASRFAAPTFSQLPDRFDLEIEGRKVPFHKEPGSPVEWTSDRMQLGHVQTTRFTMVLIPSVRLRDMHDVEHQDPSAKLDCGVVCARHHDEHGDELEGVREFIVHAPFKDAADVKSFIDAASTAMNKAYLETCRKHFEKVDKWQGK